MYTDDVTELKLLSQVFTKLIKVDYLQFKSKNMKTRKQQEIYGSWIDKSYTKMNCLSLIEYKKVLFMDADTIVLKSIDHLFELRTPAGTFSSPWGDKYGGYISLGMYPKDHKKSVHPSMVERAMNSNSVAVIGTTLLLEPDKKMFEEYKSYVSSNQPFGFPKCNSGFDEQSITTFYSRKGIIWTHIHQQYNFIPWKHNWKVKDPYVYHFFNKDKPWMLDPTEYKDLSEYYKVVKEMNKTVDISKYVPLLDKYITTDEIKRPDGGVRIVVKQKKGGIYTDALVIQEQFNKAGVECYITNDLGESNKTDLNLFIESTVDNGYLPSNDNWLLVNPEFITEFDIKFMTKCVSKVLCKTQTSVSIMNHIKETNNSGYECVYTKFTTPVTEVVSSKDYSVMVHMAGQSFLKGTYTLLKSWVKYNLESKSTLLISRADSPGDKEYLGYWKSLPSDKISSWRGIEMEAEMYKNIIFTKHIADKDALYSITGVFICPSVTEGYGHYINEGRATKSVVITTDYSPMNELVTPDTGVLIPVSKQIPIKNYMHWVKFLSTEVKASIVSEEDLCECIQQVENLTESQKQKMGDKSYSMYTNDTLFFEESMRKLINGRYKD